MKNQKNIVSSPNKNLSETKIAFEIDNKTIEFSIMSNIKPDEIYPVLDNWIARTSEYTDRSLVKYINSKSQYGFKATTI